MMNISIDENFKKALTVTIFWTGLNITLSLTNKWLFKYQGFHFPIYIIITGLLITFIGSSILVFGFKLTKLPKMEQIKNVWVLLIFSAMTHGLATGLENIAINYISISLNQVIKATTPGFTMFCSYILENRRYSRGMIVFIIFLVIGAALTTYDNPTFSFIGVVASWISCLLGVARIMINGRLLQKVEITPLALLFLTSLPAALSLLIPFIFFELSNLLSEISDPKIQKTMVFIFGMNWIAFLYIFAGLLLIKYTSAHYSTVIGTFKSVLLVIVSTVVFNTSFTDLNLFGLLVALFSFCGYNYKKIEHERLIDQKNNDYPDNNNLDPTTINNNSNSNDDNSDSVFSESYYNKYKENLKNNSNRDNQKEINIEMIDLNELDFEIEPIRELSLSDYTSSVDSFDIDYSSLSLDQI
eukprot:TRINITY_DN12849_c0_g1_i1.p1 TRINITY_DN12849_c0_g1~~TRINITY_DN12849_c0_g1_i1.p1  ORF type:complete len:413 (-),score=66.18 TRINITY_DN12849_c0_g1_i1:130-1368(-)